MDKIKQIEEHISEVMKILDIPITESNKDTPHRVAKMWVDELFQYRNNLNIGMLHDKMKVFPNDYTDNEVIIIKDIPFSSTCEHHWLPFSGTCTVGYVPDKDIIGLSKIPRVVKYFSKQPQLQEQLTQDIGVYLLGILHPKALFVEVEAKHQCVMCRGAESDCTTRTYYKNYNAGKITRDEFNSFYKDFKDRI